MADICICIICKLAISGGNASTKFTPQDSGWSVYQRRLEKALELEISETALLGKCLCFSCEHKLKKIEELREIQQSFKVQFMGTGFRGIHEQMVKIEKEESEKDNNQDQAITESDIHEDEPLPAQTPPTRKRRKTKHAQLSGTKTKPGQVPPADVPINTAPHTSTCNKGDGPATHTTSENTDCGICGMHFKTAFGLKTHMRMHQNVHSILCKLCGASFRSASTLEKHIGSEHGELKIFQCPVCVYRAASAILVRSHCRRSHRSRKTSLISRLDSVPDWPKSKQFISKLDEFESLPLCVICSVTFAKFPELEDHMLTHHKNDRSGHNDLDLSTDGMGTGKQDDGNNIEEPNDASLFTASSNEEKGAPADPSNANTKNSDAGKSDDAVNVTYSNKNSQRLKVKHVQPSVKNANKSGSSDDDGTNFTIDKDGEQSEQYCRKMANGVNAHACPECVRTFANDIDLDDHVRHHRNGKILMCALCNKGFRTQAAFENHTMQHTGKFAHKCTDCGKGFAKPWTLKTHMLIHTKEAPYTCKKCKLSFIDMKQRRAHYYKADHFPDLYKYECPHCDHLFHTIRNLDLHMLKKHKTETVQHWQCSLCDMNFEHLFEYSKHCRSEHEEEEKKFSCETCHKTFHWKNNYIAHLETHLTTKTAECQLCFKKFKGKFQLQSHMHWHSLKKKASTEQGYLCEECGKSYKNIKGLRSHLRCHSANLSFTCLICDHVAPNRSRLKKHMDMVHATERPYKCPVCDKTFVYEISYTAHYNMHNDIRPHLCSVCGKGFRTKAHLKEHMNVHSQTMSFVCNLCDKSFVWRAQLLRHKKADHANPNTPKPAPMKGARHKKPAKKAAAKAPTTIIPQAAANKTETLVHDTMVEQFLKHVSNRSSVVDGQNIILRPVDKVVDQPKVAADIGSPGLITGFSHISGQLQQSSLLQNLRDLIQQPAPAGANTTWTVVPSYGVESPQIMRQHATMNPRTELVTMTTQSDALYQTFSPGTGLSTVQQVTVTVPPPSGQLLVTTLPSLMSSSPVTQTQISIPTFAIPTPELNTTNYAQPVLGVSTVDPLQLVDCSHVSKAVPETSGADKNIIEATLAATQLLEICKNAIGHSEQLL